MIDVVVKLNHNGVSFGVDPKKFLLGQVTQL